MARRQALGPRAVVASVAAAALLALQVVVVSLSGPVAAAVPTGFSEQVAFSGLVQPTSVKFSPDGRVFVAEKRGTVQMFDSLSDTTPTRVADLRTEVFNFWDRGLLGLELDPKFTTGRPYLYVLYSYDGVIGGPAPKWGTAGADSDSCPNPPGATADGCVGSGKLAKLTLSGTSTTKQDLINDWCQQYPSHSVGDLIFGRDGALYVSGGDGASWTFADYGQDGNPVNPCGDPPGGVGGSMTPPSAEGGALRAQDLRTPGDPTGLSGTIIRVHPDTGAALPDNPAASSADANTRRIVASGLRNPFRITQRPGTDEIWIGDVGWDTYEEVNRLAAPTAGAVNFGWPCYEGDARQASYDGLNLTICEDLYAQTGADTKPYFKYRHGQSLNTNDNCSITRGSSVSGMSFSFYSGGPYPAEYDGALFFADYSRNCVWVMTKGTDGLPDKLKVKPFVSSAAGPVDLEISPAGELFYVDLSGGTIRRIVHATTGVGTCPQEQFLAEYFPNTTLSGTPATTACEPAPIDHAWGSGSPAGVGPDSFSARWTGKHTFATAGTYRFTASTNDGMRVWVDGALIIDKWFNQPITTYTADLALTAGLHDVKVEYFETSGTAQAKLGWALLTPANAGPQPQIDTPAAGTTWRVGDVVSFSGSATDAEDGALPASALSWEVILQHCPGTDCHAHPLQTFTGVATGSFTAPDHEYPAHVDLRLTARDSGGATTTVTRRLDPKTATVTVASEPAGLQLSLGQRTAAAPFTATVILGGTTSVSAPSPQALSGVSHTFRSWSDGGGQTHNVTAAATTQTYTATYDPVATSGTRTVTLTPVADVTASQATPSTNAGSATSLKSDREATDGNTSTRATPYLRFEVPPLAEGETITAASLSLQVTNGTSNGPSVWPTATGWDEMTTTWNTQPARSGTAAVGNFGSMAVGRASTPVAGVTTSGPVSFQLYADAADGLDVSSREHSTVGNRPQLILTIGTSSSTDTTPPPAPAVDPASGTYTSARSVTMSVAEAGAVIRYTVGSGTTVPADPTSTSTQYTGAITVDASQVVKAAAFDAAGNRSDITRRDYTISTATGSTRTVTLDPVADTMVRQSDAKRAFGGATTLLADARATGSGSSRDTAYLRFEVPALAPGETITATNLSVRATDGTSDGPTVWRTQTGWDEATMTWKSGQPGRIGSSPVGNFGSMGTGRVGTSVSGVAGGGPVSFQLYADSTDGLAFTSRETSTAANRPQLVLTIAQP